MRKPVLRVFYQVRHKQGFTTTEDGKRLEISDLGSRGIYHLCRENKGADKLLGHRTADLHLCLCICIKQVCS